MKKFYKIILCLSLSLAVILSFSACGKDKGETEAKSGLYGTFTYQETLGLGDSRLTITHDKNKSALTRDCIYSTVFPLDSGCEGTSVSYNMDQRLKLNRDYTYKYDYTILLSNPGDWGASFARIVVSISGTFDYRETGKEGVYNVLLSNPTGGTQTIYAPQVSGKNIYSWSIHSQPDYITDYSMQGVTYDKFVQSRMAVVDKGEKTLKDDIFFADLLDRVMAFSTY